MNQVDFSVIKAFHITEKVAMTYRCEFFNSTNRAIFNAPDLTPTSSTFGKILGQANTPWRIQMALRQGLPVFRGWGRAKLNLSEDEALALAESLPPPTFDADRRLRKLDLLEREGS